MELNLNYLKGLVDSIVSYTTEFTQEIDISDKECTHYVYPHQNGFAVRFDWIKAYVFNKVSNEDEPDYDHQILYFSKVEKKDKIIKEILSQLESIEAVDIESLTLSDVIDQSDQLQELRREAHGFS